MKYPTPTRIHRLLSGAIALCLAGSTYAKNVVEELAGRPEFSTLVTAVTEAGLAGALADAENVTVFAPDNNAFAQIPPVALAALLADKTALTNVLFYHVAPEKLDFFGLKDGPQATLLEGESVEVDVTSYFFSWFRKVEIDDARITRANIRASNGVIHRINKVLDPGFEPLPTILDIAAGDPNFSILADLVVQAGFDDALANEHARLTVFAPTNEAFLALGQETLDAVAADQALLRDILKNHIALGVKDSTTLAEAGEVRSVLGLHLPVASDPNAPAGLSVDGKPINAANFSASNGIVHVLGEVLVPTPKQSLVDVAVARDDLSTFVTAVTAAGLSGTFDSTDKWPAYTIFAPNNAAFLALPDGVLPSLLADPSGALADVLSLHVVKGRVEAASLFDGQILHSLSGEKLQVSIQEGVVRINNAVVAETDLRAENGIIHVMQDVIASAPFTVADYVQGNKHLGTLAAVLDAAMLTSALDDPDSEITLFAPLDSAFAKIPAETVEALLADPSGALTQILLYHVVGASLSAKELIEDGGAATLQGSVVEVNSRSIRFWGWKLPYSIVTVNGNRVVAADIETDNGTVHLITGVLLPPADE